MEPLDERELSRLLQQWKAPSAPASLRIPLAAPTPSIWQWLWKGSIRIPVPVGAVILIAGAIGIYSTQPVPPPTKAPVDNVITRPEERWSPPAEDFTPPATPRKPTEPAELAGFRPVTQLEPRVFEVQR